MAFLASLARRGIAFLDGLLRRAYGIHEFSDSPDCILRIDQPERAKKRVVLSDGTIIEPGDTYAEMHLWSERVPHIPPSGPDLAWALDFRRRWVQSLELLARYLEEAPRYRGVVAVQGRPLFPRTTLRSIRQLLERLGFDLFDVPSESRWDRFALRWQVMYGKWLLWTFNPASLKTKGADDWAHMEFWISRKALMRNFGPDAKGYGV